MEQWFAILELSLDGDECSAVRNRISSGLEAFSFFKKKTGRFQALGTAREVGRGLTEAIELLRGNPDILDHAWVYIERVVD